MVVGFEVVDLGLQSVEVALLVEAAVGVEGEYGIDVDDDSRGRGEALDVEEGEADALAGHVGQ